MKEHGQMVWSLAWRMLGNEADVSDCYQEVFIKAVQAARRQAIGNMPAFLNKLTVQRAIDILRKRKRSAGCCGLGDYDLPDSGIESPDSNLQAAELRAQIRTALTHLPDREAEAFALKAFNDLSYRQIAKELKVKENYVGVLLNRAKEKLQRQLSFAAVEFQGEVACD